MTYIDDDEDGPTAGEWQEEVRQLTASLGAAEDELCRVLDVLDKTETALANAESELLEAARIAADSLAASQELEAKLREAEDTTKALRAALEKYGSHIDGCGHGWACSCGFYEVLGRAI